MSNHFLNLLNDSEVLVCVGSGGVGKTTVASALAYKAALQGRRVLVLTVDPSKRLKTIMGIGESDTIVRIQRPEITGELWASVIDPKKTFDDFILRASKYSEKAKLILNNKLYIQLSTRLNGSQEFTALEKLYSAKESGSYDLIVLDTPPTKHAIDFLEAPQKLSTLFSDTIAKWFRDPEGKNQNIFKRLLQVGTQQVLKALEILTGSEFMRELSEFFRNIESWQSKLETRISDVHRLLINPKTHFVLVSSLDEAKIQEAKFFMREIQKGGYHLSALIINRALPFWIKFPADSHISALEKKMRDYYEKRASLLSNVEKELPFVVRLPELKDNVSDFEGVQKIAEEIK